MIVHLRHREIGLAFAASAITLLAGVVGRLLPGGFATILAVSAGVGLIVALNLEMYRRTEVLRAQSQAQTEGLVSIYACLKLNGPLPMLRGAAILPDTAQLLVLTVFDLRPACILELGSGSSTILLAYALKQVGGGKIISIEHEERYLGFTRKSLEAHGLSEYVELVHAPLREVALNGQTYRWYDTSFLERVGAVDLLFVDGPPGYIGSMMRYPALPLLHRVLTPNAVIILDDAQRQDEQVMVSRWLQQFTDFDRQYIEGEKGTVILRRTAIPSARQQP